MSDHLQNIAPVIERMDQLGKSREAFFFIIDFEMEKPVVIPVKDLDASSIRFKCNDFKNYQVRKAKEKTQITFERHPVSWEEYVRAFRHVIQNLEYGNSFLTNLTRSE